MEKDNSFAWTKEEYASIHWDGVKEYINELDNESHNDIDKIIRLVGYLQRFYDAYRKLPYEYEII